MAASAVTVETGRYVNDKEDWCKMLEGLGTSTFSEM